MSGKEKAPQDLNPTPAQRILIGLGLLGLALSPFVASGFNPAHSELLPGSFLIIGLMLYRNRRQEAWPFLLLLFFGYLFSAEALNLTIDTQVPRIKLMFRGAFYIQAISLVYHQWTGRSALMAGLYSLILYGCFLYAPAYKFFPVSSYILLCGALLVSGFSLPRQETAPWTAVVTLLLFLAGVSVSWFLATDLVHAGEGYLRIATGVLILAIAYRLEERDALGLFKFSAFLTLFFFGWCLPSHSAGSSLMEVIVQKYSYIGNINTNDMATGMLLLLGPLAYAARLEKSGPGRIFSVLLFAGIALLLFHTKARSSIASLAIALLIAGTILLLKRGKIKALIPLSAAFALLAVALPLLLSHFSLGWLSRVESLEARVILWDAALRAIGKAPLFGYGPDVFAQISAYVDPAFARLVPVGYQELSVQLRQSSYFHSHNTYLQWMMELGIAGAIPIAVLFSACLIWIRGLKAGSQGQSTLLDFAGVGLVAFCITSFFNYTLMVEQIWILLCLNLSLYSRRQRTSISPGRQQWITVTAGGLLLSVGVLICAQLYSFQRWSQKAADHYYLTPTEDLIASDEIFIGRPENPPSILFLSPGDGRVSQLYAEMSLWAASRAESTQSCNILLEQATRHFKICSRHNDHPAYCQFRSNQISYGFMPVQDPVQLTHLGIVKNASTQSALASEVLGQMNHSVVDCNNL
ncbi:MAG: O-antigen ligase family protein [Leptospiraceae bacterium]|nr:O-antigen ligase family protein [Leptospiraceae bacterium]